MNRLAIVVLSLWCVGLAAVASAQTLRVTADRTNVRDKASTDGAIVAAVSKGDELEVLDRSGSWYHVRVKSTGAQGYVNALVVEPAPGGGGGTAAPAPPAAGAPPAAATPPAAEQRPAPQTPAPPAAGGPLGGDRKFFIRPFGGLWTGYYTTGFGGGVGVATRPFSLPELELEIDVAVAHQTFDYGTYFGSRLDTFSANLIQGSGNVIYNFKLPNSSFVPFAGAGLQYSHESFNVGYCSGFGGCGAGFDGIGFQAIGGIELPINDRRAWRFQVRGGNGLMLLAGISF